MITLQVPSSSTAEANTEDSEELLTNEEVPHNATLIQRAQASSDVQTTFNATQSPSPPDQPYLNDFTATDKIGFFKDLAVLAEAYFSPSISEPNSLYNFCNLPSLFDEVVKEGSCRYPWPLFKIPVILMWERIFMDIYYNATLREDLHPSILQNGIDLSLHILRELPSEPITIQRICELLNYNKYYYSSKKLYFAFRRLVFVQSCHCEDYQSFLDIHPFCESIVSDPILSSFLGLVNSDQPTKYGDWFTDCENDSSTRYRSPNRGSVDNDYVENKSVMKRKHSEIENYHGEDE